MSIMYTLEREIMLNDDEVGYKIFDVEVDYNYYPRIPGYTEYGLKMEPDSPPEVEILHVMDSDGRDVKLNQDELEAVTDYIINYEENVL